MYIVGYPKSGNTWLCYLLSYCLNSEYDDFDDPGVHPRDEYQRRYVKGGFKHKSYQDKFGRVLKTHRLSLPDEHKPPVVYLVRDGRDVMVSYYYYLKSHYPESLLKLHDNVSPAYRFTGRFRSTEKRVFGAFLRENIAFWRHHIHNWLEKNPTALVRYEDLKTAPENSLKELFQKIGVEIGKEVITDALEIFNFKKMSGRKAGDEDTRSFFRKGISGDWKNHFTRSDLRYFKKATEDIYRLIGYRL